jgi:excisionase family DNA binding protein
LNSSALTADPPAGRVISVSVEEMASTIGITKKHAYRLLDKGVIESRYLGRRRLVSWESLNAYMKTRHAFEESLANGAVLTVEEMAAAIGVSTKQAYRLLNWGVIESGYRGRQRLVSLDSLNTYMKSLPTERE